MVYMGAEDVKRQSPNVYRMKLLGATVVPVESGSKTLKDALNEAMRDWVANVDNTFTSSAPWQAPPYPMMVRDFQSVDWQRMPEADARDDGRAGSARQRRWPAADAVIACVGGGSNAMGIFYPYIDHAHTAWIGVKPPVKAWTPTNTSSLQKAAPACCTATAPTSCKTPTARSPKPTASARAFGLPGVGPEHYV